MPRLPLYNMQGETVGDIELSPRVWEAQVNEALLHQAVVTYLANQRVGTASTKTRAEVRGGGRKPWRQKGLGRARHGSIRSPIWKGGGITFGPKPRDYRKKFNVKARRQALRSALSAKVAEDAVKVIEELVFQEPRTAVMVKVLQDLALAGHKTLIVTDGSNEAAYKSARNIPGVAMSSAQNLHTYKVLNHQRLLLTREAVGAIEEVLDRG